MRGPFDQSENFHDYRSEWGRLFALIQDNQRA
jgi:hypothetical protein